MRTAPVAPVEDKGARLYLSQFVLIHVVAVLVACAVECEQVRVRWFAGLGLSGRQLLVWMDACINLEPGPL